MKYIALVLLVSNTAFANFIVKKSIVDNKEIVESVRAVNFEVKKITTLKSIESFIAEKDKMRPSLYQEIAYPKNLLPKKYLKFQNEKKSFWAGSEVREIVKTGDDNNRITITVLGDGYTELEKKKLELDFTIDFSTKTIEISIIIPIEMHYQPGATSTIAFSNPGILPSELISEVSQILQLVQFMFSIGYTVVKFTS